MYLFSCFKFRPVNDWLIDQIKDSAIYFPHRAQLNDPFDCNIDIKSAIEKVISNRPFPNAELLRNFQRDESHLNRFSNNVAKIGIGSFSLTLDETLLWSHYASNHRGVALRYEFSEEFLNNENLILGVSAVSYQPNAISEWLAENADLYRWNHKAFIIGLLQKYIMSKSPSWAYEEEARITIPESGLLNVPRKSLTHIAFGLKTTEADKELIKNTVAEYCPSVKFGQAVRKNDDYGIGIEEI
jgi:hypothetical protein